MPLPLGYAPPLCILSALLRQFAQNERDIITVSSRTCTQTIKRKHITIKRYERIQNALSHQTVHSPQQRNSPNRLRKTYAAFMNKRSLFSDNSDHILKLIVTTTVPKPDSRAQSWLLIIAYDPSPSVWFLRGIAVLRNFDDAVGVM